MKLTLIYVLRGMNLLLGLALVWLLAGCGPASPAAPTQGSPAETLSLTPTQTATVTGTSEALPAPGEAGLPPLARPWIGVEAHRVDAATPDQLAELGVSMVRRNALLWSQVEPVEGQRNWEAAAELEEDLKVLASRGIQVILIVRSTPDWAQKVPGYACGPVKRGKIEAFARFMSEAVARYSVPPFSVKYWELGNEPDVDPSLVAPNSVYGCWGDQQDATYGGAYYARVLKGIYPAIKSADPQAQVLIGGLLLDCDPTHPPEDRDCKGSRFLEGIFQAGGGDFFDIVSFHGYPPYGSNLETDEFNPLWASRGGVVMGRISYLREVMAAYGVDKPLMHTESSLMCPDWNPSKCNPPGPEFFEAQADYLTILYVRNWAAGVDATVWYQFEGPSWRHVGLLDEQGAPKPAYRALRFFHQELQNAMYTGPYTLTPEVRGAEFVTADKQIWVLWSPDAQPDAVSLPESVLQVLDKYGNPLPWEGGTLNVLSPVYIELNRSQ